MFPIVNGKMKILYAEDNRATADAMGAMTEELLGYDVKIVTNGNQVIDAIRTYQPNIIVLDLEMPGKNGDVLCDEILNDPELRDIQVVVSSCHLVGSAEPGCVGERFKQVFKKHGEPRNWRPLHNDDMEDYSDALTAASIEGYGKIPAQLKQYWEKNDPKRPVPAETL